MSYTREAWEQKRKKGLAKFLLMDGVLFTGGPFAVILQVVGYFLLGEEGQSFGQYFTATQTWVTFILHGTLFGGIMGFIKWRMYENAFPPASDPNT